MKFVFSLFLFSFGAVVFAAPSQKEANSKQEQPLPATSATRERAGASPDSALKATAGKAKPRGTTRENTPTPPNKTKATRLKSSKSRAARAQTASQDRPSLRKISGQEGDLGPSHHRKARQTRELLLDALNSRLEALSAICRLTEESKKRRLELLKENLAELSEFVTQTLRDPYMDYSLRLDFGDIFDILREGEGFFPEGEESFALIYRVQFNLPESTAQSDWPHVWAKTLFSSIKCAHTDHLEEL